MGLRPTNWNEIRRLYVGRVNLRPIGNRPPLACKRAQEPGDAFFKGAVMTLRVAESDEKYKRRVFFEGAVMTRRGSKKAMKNTTGR